jgi:hypothetical protein
MKQKAFRGLLGLLLGLTLLAGGSGASNGFGLILNQIQAMGPRQWLSVTAGSLILRAAVAAPMPNRIADRFHHLSFLFPAAADSRRSA